MQQLVLQNMQLLLNLKQIFQHSDAPRQNPLVMEWKMLYVGCRWQEFKWQVYKTIKWHHLNLTLSALSIYCLVGIPDVRCQRINWMPTHKLPNIYRESVVAGDLAVVYDTLCESQQVLLQNLVYGLMEEQAFLVPCVQ